MLWPFVAVANAPGAIDDTCLKAAQVKRLGAGRLMGALVDAGTVAELRSSVAGDDEGAPGKVKAGWTL